MKKETLQQVLSAITLLNTMAKGEGHIETARKSLVQQFEALHNRNAACLLGLAILDAEKLPERVNGKRTGAMSNRRRDLARAVNAAYPDYPERVRFRTHKTAPASFVLVAPTAKSAKEKALAAVQRLFPDVNEKELSAVLDSAADAAARRKKDAADAAAQFTAQQKQRQAEAFKAKVLSIADARKLTTAKQKSDVAATLAAMEGLSNEWAQAAIQ